MDNSWKIEVATCLGALAEAFGRTVTPATIHAYELGLAGIDAESLQHATAAALRTCKFMPTPAELRELSGEMKPTERSIHAFMALERAVVRVGGYRTVNFDDPILNATVRALGGWDQVCQTTEREWNTFFRNRFMETYRALASSGVSDEQASVLAGIHDETNCILGGYEPQRIEHVATGLPPLLGQEPRVIDRRGIEAPKRRGGEVKQIGEVLSK